MPWLVALALGWVGGLLLAPCMAHHAAQAGVAVLSVTLGASALLIPSDRAAASRWKLLLALCAVGLGLSTGPAAQGLPPETIPRGLARVEGWVEDVRHLEGADARSTLRVTRGERLRDAMPVPAGARLRLSGPPLAPSSQVRLVAKLRPHARFRNPTPHPRPAFGAAVQGRGRLVDEAAAATLRQPLHARLLQQARSGVREALRSTLPPRVAGIARALVLGDGSAVAVDDREAVRDAGMAHMLAVSGLHVAVLAGLAVWLLQRVLLRLPLAHRVDARRWACGCGIPIALLHAAFAGGSDSAWRAALMAVMAWGLVALGRRPAASSVGALAVLALSAWRPEHARQPGFLLSVTATAAILSTSLQAPRGAAGWLRAAWRLSWRTSLATAPIVLWWFEKLPWVGTLANLWLMPLGSVLVVPLAAAHAASAMTTPALAAITGRAFTLSALAFVEASQWLSELPTLAPPPLTPGQGLAVAGLAAVGLSRARWRSKGLLAGGLLVVLLGLELGLRMQERPQGILRVSFLDVGQGDAALVDLPDGRAMLIDTGGSVAGGPDPGRLSVAPLLAARRRQRLDVVVLTHPHPDHYAGLEALLDAVEVGEVWTSGQATAEERPVPMLELLERLRRRGVRVRTADTLCGHTRDAGDARFQVLWPCPRFDPGYGPNDNSLVLKLRFGAHRFLFTGDIEQHGESSLVRERGAALGADVLKVPHHGSRTSSSEAFVEAVSPTWAAISSGLGNHFGHPDEGVVQRLRTRGAHVLRLSRQGGSVFESDGERLEVSTWAGHEARLEAPAEP